MIRPQENTMAKVTIIGAGNMGGAIAALAITGGNEVQLLARDATAPPQRTSRPPPEPSATPSPATSSCSRSPTAAVQDVLAPYAGQLDGKTIVDITNPLDFGTFDSLVVPAGGSPPRRSRPPFPEHPYSRPSTPTSRRPSLAAPSAARRRPSSSRATTRTPRPRSPRSSRPAGSARSTQARSSAPTSSRRSASCR